MNIICNNNFINDGEVPIIKSFLSLTLEKGEKHSVVLEIYQITTAGS